MHANSRYEMVLQGAKWCCTTIYKNIENNSMSIGNTLLCIAIEM